MKYNTFLLVNKPGFQRTCVAKYYSSSREESNRRNVDNQLAFNRLFSYVLYFLNVRKIIRFDFADELKIGGLRYICTT